MRISSYFTATVSSRVPVREWDTWLFANLKRKREML
jgi:hypothetical protein